MTEHLVESTKEIRCFPTVVAADEHHRQVGCKLAQAVACLEGSTHGRLLGTDVADHQRG